MSIVGVPWAKVQYQRRGGLGCESKGCMSMDHVPVHCTLAFGLERAGGHALLNCILIKKK